jgi:imidazole glycerol-phosphate synthase subunit HisH
MTAVHIVDIGAGNIASVANALYRAGGEPILVKDPDMIASADRIVLPGVGAAGDFLARLRERHMEEALTRAVRERGRPMLGICVGMQVLAENLYEFGHHKGLGWFKGDVISLREIDGAFPRVPHMGWNEIEAGDAKPEPISAMRNQRTVYFCHSYVLRGAEPATIAATVDYGRPVIAAIARDSVMATQFHPEKSQHAGARLLEAFLDWSP